MTRRERLDWRSGIYRVVATLVALLYLVLFEGGHAALEAWVPMSTVDDADRWHQVVYGLFSVLAGGALALTVLRPRRVPAVMQLYVVLGLLLTAVELLAQGAPLGLAVTSAVLVGIPLAAYPEPRALLVWQGRRTGLWPLVAVTAALAAVEVVVNLQRHLTDDGSPHLDEGHWIGAMGLAVAVTAAGAVAAVGRPGWRVAARLLAGVLVLGGASALALAEQDGSWGYPGGGAALCLGLAWALASFRDVRTREDVDSPVPARA